MRRANKGRTSSQPRMKIYARHPYRSRTSPTSNWIILKARYQQSIPDQRVVWDYASTAVSALGALAALQQMHHRTQVAGLVAKLEVMVKAVLLAQVNTFQIVAPHSKLGWWIIQRSIWMQTVVSRKSATEKQGQSKKDRIPLGIKTLDTVSSQMVRHLWALTNSARSWPVSSVIWSHSQWARSAILSMLLSPTFYLSLTGLVLRKCLMSSMTREKSYDA